MNEISVIMPVYNACDFLTESIESILKQSFDDFELIIIDDGSTDNSVEIIQSYKDKRIKLYKNNHNFIESLNKGIAEASGKYIARMDADDIMHIDRLKIQHAIMEEEPAITISGSSMIPFGEDVKPEHIYYSGNGLIYFPLIQLLKGNLILHPTAIIRTDFLRTHKLQYENYPHAEDYKLWFEIAKKGGIFFVESQPLLYYRMHEKQISRSKAEEQEKTKKKIIKGILEYLVDLNKQKYPQISLIFENMILLEKEGLTDFNHIPGYFHTFFSYNKMRLNVI